MAEHSADHIPEEEPSSTPNGTDWMERDSGGRTAEHRSPSTSSHCAESAESACAGNSALPRELRRPHSNRPRSKEHKRLNAQRLVLQYIAPCMNSYGLCIVDNFLGDKLGDRILQEVRRVHEDGRMQDGQLACQTLGQTKAIRGDKIAWVEGTETGCHNIGVLLSRIDKLITFADGRLGSYKIRGRHKDFFGISNCFIFSTHCVASLQIEHNGMIRSTPWTSFHAGNTHVYQLHHAAPFARVSARRALERRCLHARAAVLNGGCVRLTCINEGSLHTLRLTRNVLQMFLRFSNKRHLLRTEFVNENSLA
ncbi:egl nine-like 3 isoform X1 [Silurus asotus]|uniref:Egl nine-like 3 isoform X1 n=1 Tax=Silurus asotus TaxID=30991 RepID=A0AAD5A8A2_SILAS|nr:egl nine-like 3 isoform X1 [Silurus asotus]